MTADPVRRRAIHRIITRQHGLTLQVDAMQYLEQTLDDYGIAPDALAATLDLIAKTYKHDHHATARAAAAASGTGNGSAAVNQGAAASGASRIQSAVTRDDIALVVSRLANNASGSAATYNSGASQSEDALADPTAAIGDDVDLPSLVHVVSAFDMPRWRYAPEHKAFFCVSALPSAMAEAQSKLHVHRDRYELLRQRILRHPDFRPAAFSAGPGTAAAGSDRMLTLTSIASLRGNERRHFVLFGMLTRLDSAATGSSAAGKVYLEDASGVVQLDLADASKGRGFFTETCFVVVEGVYTADRIFKVAAMAMPPAESRLATKEAFGQLDFLGAPPDVYDDIRLEQIQNKFDGITMVFLSDVHLDQPKTIAALRFLFTVLDAPDQIPLVLCLAGNFSSVPVSSATYRDLWTSLAGLIATFPNLAVFTTWVFIPGPTDPWGAHVAPRAPLPKYFTGKVASKLSRCVFASMPTRIKYCSTEVVVGREEYAKRLARNCVVPPASAAPPGSSVGAADEMPYHLARTMVDQAHMMPLPLHIRPVQWEYDHALHLYPAPHVVVACDGSAGQFHEEYEGVHVVNPGSFSVMEQWNFTKYYPAVATVEQSRLPRDAVFV
ncbi:DNA polymerase alpha/epsilon subunit B-domain-containing protein [Blastocladiella britannica]|nr:DNA polymerase alpha/epsilon subunit B-domain-containing protein [Blastocladiella britannica]